MGASQSVESQTVESQPESQPVESQVSSLESELKIEPDASMDWFWPII